MAEINKGWIKLDRSITDHWIFSDAEKFRAWIDLLIQANHESKKVLLHEGVLIIKRGQFVTSIDSLAKRWEWSRSRVYRFLELLETEQMVKRDSNQFRTLLTIENYGKFQGVRNTNETTNETTSDTTNETTNETRPRNKRINKNDKECKKSVPHYSDDPERNEEIIEALKMGAVLLPDGSLDYSGGTDWGEE